MNAYEALDELLSTTNAQEWARVFCEQFGGDEELMLVWFANAIETGRNAGAAMVRASTRVDSGWPY